MAKENGKQVILPPNRTDEEYEMAFRVYCEVGSVNRTALLTGIPYSTLKGHAQKNSWKEAREKALTVLEGSPSQYLQKVDEFVQELALESHDADSYKNIKQVELICMQTIKGMPVNVDGKKAALVPETFKEAVNALKITWDAKERLLTRVLGTKDADKPKTENNFTLNIVDMVRRHGSINAEYQEVEE